MLLLEPWYGLNEVPRILAILIFPIEVFGLLWRNLIVFLEFTNFPLIILLETNHTKQIGSIKKWISVSALITIYFNKILNECCKTERFG